MDSPVVNLGESEARGSQEVPSLKSLLFRHLLFKLGRAGHGPWAGHASVLTTSSLASRENYEKFSPGYTLY